MCIFSWKKHKNAKILISFFQIIELATEKYWFKQHFYY